MSTEKMKKEFIIPYIYTSYFNFRIRLTISFQDLKEKLGIDLLKFERLGTDILINSNSNVTLEFMSEWVIFNSEPFLTDSGMLKLFYHYEKAYSKFIKKYSRFLYTDGLAKRLNNILDEKAKIIKRKEEERSLILKKIDKTSVHIEYIRQFIPNF